MVAFVTPSCVDRQCFGYVHVCLSVCLFVHAVTFEVVNMESSFLVWWYIGIILVQV